MRRIIGPFNPLSNLKVTKIFCHDCIYTKKISIPTSTPEPKHVINDKVNLSHVNMVYNPDQNKIISIPLSIKLSNNLIEKFKTINVSMLHFDNKPMILITPWINIQKKLFNIHRLPKDQYYDNPYIIITCDISSLRCFLEEKLNQVKHSYENIFEKTNNTEQKTSRQINTILYNISDTFKAKFYCKDLSNNDREISLEINDLDENLEELKESINENIKYRLYLTVIFNYYIDTNNTLYGFATFYIKKIEKQTASVSSILPYTDNYK